MSSGTTNVIKEDTITKDEQLHEGHPLMHVEVKDTNPQVTASGSAAISTTTATTATAAVSTTAPQSTTHECKNEGITAAPTVDANPLKLQEVVMPAVNTQVDHIKKEEAAKMEEAKLPTTAEGEEVVAMKCTTVVQQPEATKTTAAATQEITTSTATAISAAPATEAATATAISATTVAATAAAASNIITQVETNVSSTLTPPPIKEIATSSTTASINESTPATREATAISQQQQEEGGAITEEINSNDVLCGRGAGTNKHIGNVKFRQLVQANQHNYIVAKVVDKVFIAGSIVDAIHERSPAGRFLRKIVEKENKWVEISKQQAREKTSQALREKPDRKQQVNHSKQLMQRVTPMVMDGAAMHATELMPPFSTGMPGAAPSASMEMPPLQVQQQQQHQQPQQISQEQHQQQAMQLQQQQGMQREALEQQQQQQQHHQVPQQQASTQNLNQAQPQQLNNTPAPSTTTGPPANNNAAVAVAGTPATSVSEVVTNLTSAVHAMSQVAVKLESAMQAANIAYAHSPFISGTAIPQPSSALTPIAPAPTPVVSIPPPPPLTQIKPEASIRPLGRSSSRGMAAMHLNPNAIPIQKHQLTDNDVLFGRGGVTNNHVGNRRYRELVRAHQQAYLVAPKTEKAQIARKIVDIIRHHRDPPGRFLVKGEVSGTWVDVGDDRSREKTSQALREKAPEMRRVLTAAAGLVGVNKVVMNQNTNTQQINNNKILAAHLSANQHQQAHGMSMDPLKQQNKDIAPSLPSIPLPPPPLPAPFDVNQMHGNKNVSHNTTPTMYAPPPTTNMSNVIYSQNIHPHSSHHQQHQQPNQVITHQQDHQQQQQHSQNDPNRFYHMNSHPSPQSNPNLYYPSMQQHQQQQQQHQPHQQQHQPEPHKQTGNPQTTHQHQHHQQQQQQQQPAPHHVRANLIPTPQNTTPVAVAPQPSSYHPIQSTSAISDASSSPNTLRNNDSSSIQITQNDVLYGRGAGINCHIGNQRFRALVKYNQKAYLEAPKLLKGDIARSIVASIRNAAPPGRFLSQDSHSGKWVEVDDNKACEKTSQALREKAPEIRKGLVVLSNQLSPQQHQHQHQHIPNMPTSQGMSQGDRKGNEYYGAAHNNTAPPPPVGTITYPDERQQQHMSPPMQYKPIVHQDNIQPNAALQSNPTPPHHHHQQQHPSSSTDHLLSLQSPSKHVREPMYDNHNQSNKRMRSDDRLGLAPTTTIVQQQQQHSSQPATTAHVAMDTSLNENMQVSLTNPVVNPAVDSTSVAVPTSSTPNNVTSPSVGPITDVTTPTATPNIVPVITTTTTVTPNNVTFTPPESPVPVTAAPTTSNNSAPVPSVHPKPESAPPKPELAPPTSTPKNELPPVVNTAPIPVVTIPATTTDKVAPTESASITPTTTNPTTNELSNNCHTSTNNNTTDTPNTMNALSMASQEI